MRHCALILTHMTNHLFVVAEEDTEHQGDKSQQGQAEPKVGHVVLPLRLGQAVGQS